MFSQAKKETIGAPFIEVSSDKTARLHSFFLRACFFAREELAKKEKDNVTVIEDCLA